VIAAALYLTRRSLANSFRNRVRRLRQPKYAAAFGMGVLYLWWFFFRPSSPGAAVSFLDPDARETVAVLLAALVLVISWTVGSEETPFPFTLAETQFLFAAPLTRRQVLLFKILRSQSALMMSAAFSVVLFSRGRWNSVTLLHAIGLWLAYATLNLNSAGMGLLRLSLSQHGVAGVRRRAGMLVVLATALGAAWWALRTDLPVIEAAFGASFGAGVDAVTRALHTGAGAVLSWPLRAMVDPLLARTPRDLLAALPAGLLMLGAHIWWVVGSSLAFEEAATEAAVRRARQIDAMRKGRGWTGAAKGSAGLQSSRLAERGSIAGAIAWKNMLGIRREFSPRSLVIIGVATVAGVLSLHGQRLPPAEALAGILMFAAALVTLLGPLALRYDLRRDLELLDVLKSYPVRGRTVVQGEVGALLLTLSGVAGVLVVAAFLLTLTDPSLPELGDRAAILAAVLAGIPTVMVVFLLVQNASVLLFPAWVTVGAQRAVGLEATGQRMLLTLGSLLALVIALLPAAVVAVVVMWGAGFAGVGGPWSVTAGVLGGAAVVGGESWIAMRLLGGVFDRLDPSSAGIP